MRSRLSALLLATALAACSSHESTTRGEPVPATPAGSRARAEPARTPAADRAAPIAPPAQAGGPWRIAAVSVRTPEETAAYVQRLQAAGFRVEIEAALIGGTGWQRVVLPGYASRAQAQAAIPAVNALLDDGTAWVLPQARPAEVMRARPPAPTAEPTPKN